MIPVSSAAEVRAMDAAVIEGLGLPGVALMELASRAVAEQVRHHPASTRGEVLVVCGPGNNGGDGWAAARWLHGWGLQVRVWPVAGPASQDAKLMAMVAQAAGVPVGEGLGASTLVVDAVLGTGLSSPVRESVDAVLRQIGEHGAPVVAVDLPSGLHADTGEALGAVPTAESTVTFARAKRGLYAGQGPSLAGKVVVADIGLSAATPRTARRGAGLLEAHDLSWPRLPADGHKGIAGHVAVVAGSQAMAGAAVLACRGALAGGAGRVTLFTAKGALPRLAALPPEVMVRLSGGEVLHELPQLDGFDAVVVGPGLGGGDALSDGLHAHLVAWWRDAPVATVFDADALVCTGPSPAKHARVLTPHPGEAGRLLGRSSREVQRDRYAAARSLAARGVVLLKGQYTLIDDGNFVAINPTGSPALATGGTGDVLAGLVGALLGRGVAAPVAAGTAAYVHGLAGDAVGRGATASQVADRLVAAAAALPERPATWAGT